MKSTASDRRMWKVSAAGEMRFVGKGLRIGWVGLAVVVVACWWVWAEVPPGAYWLEGPVTVPEEIERKEKAEKPGLEGEQIRPVVRVEEEERVERKEPVGVKAVGKEAEVKKGEAVGEVSVEGERQMLPEAAAGTVFYPVSEFQLMYQTRARRVYSLERVKKDLVVSLAQTSGGYVAAVEGKEGQKIVRFRLADVPKLAEKRFSASAIASINQQLVAYYNNVVGVIGVVVRPHPEDIDEQGRDLRREAGPLRLVIQVGVVGEVRTLASGERFPVSVREDHPAHQRIKENSPIQPGQWLMHRELEGYVGQLSRHPGRRVDVALSRGTEEGTIALDYLVAENKPWYVFVQGSNTGTESTNKWRQRFGFVHNQLTDRDDILELQYTTACFDEAHAVQAAYEFPLGDQPGLRMRIFGGYSEYTASDVGFPGQDFEGHNWEAGGRVTCNIFRYGDLFVDAYAGLRWLEIAVEGATTGWAEEKEDFFLPSVGLAGEYRSLAVNWEGAVGLEFNVGDVLDTEASESFAGLRANIDDDWAVLQWSQSLSFYLEPMLNPEAWAKADPKDNSATLAHEVAVMFEGQYAMGYRLPPQFERVMGGLYTVRGYPESAVVGDDAVIVRGEYRFHIPRIFPVNSLRPMPNPLGGPAIRLARSEAFGRPDWDLVLRAFIDVGRTMNSDRESGERDQTLVGSGVGLELQIKHNVSVRADWGVALKEVRNGLGQLEVDDGSNRFHLVFTVLY